MSRWLPSSREHWLANRNQVSWAEPEASQQVVAQGSSRPTPHLLQADSSTERRLQEATHSALDRVLVGSSQVLAANQEASRDSVQLGLESPSVEDRPHQLKMTLTTSLST